MAAHERPLTPPCEAVAAYRDDVDPSDLAEVEAAVALVQAGAAVRVRLVGLRDPTTIAGIAAAMAQAGGVSVRLVPGHASDSLIVGPRA